MSMSHVLLLRRLHGNSLNNLAAGRWFRAAACAGGTGGSYPQQV